MMKAAYSPAPWTAQGPLIVSSDGYAVAAVGSPDITDEMADANIRLMEAAPQLLEALDRLAGPTGDLFDDKAHAMAHAAIAKATGQ